MGKSRKKSTNFLKHKKTLRRKKMIKRTRKKKKGGSGKGNRTRKKQKEVSWRKDDIPSQMSGIIPKNAIDVLEFDKTEAPDQIRNYLMSLKEPKMEKMEENQNINAKKS